MTSRRLQFQTLEHRHLLAGDLCAGSQLESAHEDSAQQETSLFTTAGLFQAADAGASRGTAFDLGDVDGARQIRGRLGGWDRIDMLRFSIQRDADIELSLTQLNRNADLFLANDAGRVVAMSTRSGRQSEFIVESLDAGDYYLAVIARSFRQISYRLKVSAQLAPAPETPDPPQTSPPDVTTTPVPPTAPPTVEATPPSPGTSTGVAPLADVDYFGGNRDWNLNAIGAPEAWAAGYTGQGVTVAVVDTGVDLDHPDLVNSLYVNPGEVAGNGVDDDGNGFVDDVHGYDFASGDANPDDGNGHGTHVAGTIAAGNNGFGATGVAPGAKILPVRVLGNNGSGSDRGVAAGIRYAAALGADIINLSLGGGYSRTIQSAIDYAQSLGSLIVAAAGNESASSPGYPARFSANYNHVISVGAFNASGRIAGFSNDVGSSRSVQVDAPGVGVFSTYAGGGYASISGTSMASPHVAGLAALTLSSNPNLTSQELRDLLAGGVVGTAIGSDSLGKANATTSVAYAAAGLTTASQIATNNASIGSRPSESNVVRANRSVDLIADLSLSDPYKNDNASAVGPLTVNPPATIRAERRLVSAHAPRDNPPATEIIDLAITEAVADHEVVPEARHAIAWGANSCHYPHLDDRNRTRTQ